MLKFFYHCFVFLFLLLFSKANDVSICQYDTRKTLIVVALLNLYDETTGCTKRSMRGLQQTTLLEKVVADINHKDALSEGMSMGFIGPENYKQFQEVNKITSVFGKFHIVPFAPTVRRSKEENSVMYVGTGRFQLRSKILLAVLNQLEWRSIYVIVGESVALSGLIEYLLNEIDRLCVTGVSKIPKDLSTIKNFFETAVAEFQESGADGIFIAVEDPAHLRPILVAMNELSGGKRNIPFIFYINRIGLKSWELPQNNRILVLQETSELTSDVDLKSLYNKTLWADYIQENGLDYQKDVLGDLLDSTIVPLEFGLNLLWNTAKYAKRLKCNLGNLIASGEGVCRDMLNTNSKEWKTFLQKASYYDQVSLRKISFEMKVPVTVKVYYHEIGFVNPQLIGRITEIGIMDLKMSLQSVIATGARTNPKRCASPSTKMEDVPIPTTINHETNWLATVSKKMKNLIQLEGIVSPQTNEKINTAVVWIVGIIVFFFGLILITKCVYTIFRVETEDVMRENRRRKPNRTTRIMSD